jgi:hypothetical protein
MQSKEKLTTLCGLRKEDTELDFSGRRLDAGDAVLIANDNDISDMGAMTSLDFSNNGLVSYLGFYNYDHSGELPFFCFHTQHQF